MRFPSYNALSVRDVVAASRPDALALTPLPEGALATPSWQDSEEIALPLSVVPWAKQRGLPLYPVLEPSPDPEAQAEFRRYLSQYAKTRSTLMEVERALQPVQELLEQTLSLTRIQQELLPRLREYQELREEKLEPGPGSDWLRERTERMAERILALPHEHVAVLASSDHLPFLEDALNGKADVRHAPSVEPSEAVRERSLLDFAFRVDVPEPGNVIAKLRDMTSPEARYHEANLLLANGHVAEALETLEMASRGDFFQPYFLPGYLLARLGQLRDLAGEREGALRAYRGVLAFDWAPQEAVQVAQAGLASPFVPEQEPA